MANEPIQIPVQTPGADEAAKLADILADLQKRIAGLDDQIARGVPGWELAWKAKEKLAAEADKAAQALDRLTKSQSRAQAKAQAVAAQAQSKAQVQVQAQAQAMPALQVVDVAPYELADATLHELANSYVVLAGATKQFTAEEAAAITTTGALGKVAQQAAQEAQHLGQVQVVSWQRAGSAAEHATAATQAYASKLNAGSRRASGGLNTLSYKLGVIGATLDDLQYVGEMGLRPILNNLMMIHPVLGITAIALDQARKHMDELKAAGKGIAEYWGLAGATEQTTALGEAWKGVAGFIGTAAKSAEDFVTGLKDGWAFMSGSDVQGMKDRVKEFTSKPSDANAGRGQSLKKALGERDRAEVVAELVSERAKIDKGLQGNSPAAERNRLEEQARVVDVLERAMKGDANALHEFENRAKGTRIGADYRRQEASRTEDKGEIKRVQAAREAAEKRADEHNEQVDKLKQQQEKQFNDRADELSKGFEDRIGRRLLENATMREGAPGKKTAEQMRVDETNAIAEHLKKTGQAGDDAEALKMAQAIMQRVAEATGKDLRKRVNEKGITPDQAARELVAEAKAKDEKKDEAARDLATKQAKDRLDKDVGDQIARRMLRGELQGGKASDVDKALTAELKQFLERSGMGEGAGLAAESMVEEARKKVEGDLTEKRENPNLKEQRSEIHGGADFSKTLLTAKTGNDAEQKSLRVQERMLGELARVRELAEQQRQNPPVARLG